MLNKLDFKTQNQERIDTTACVPIGNTAAAFCDLLNLFGLPRIGGERDDQIQWDVRFADGCIATIYNWSDEPESVGNWFVGGTSTRCVERVNTLVSLRNEIDDPDAAIEETLSNADAFMQTVEKRHGKNFYRVLRIARDTYKLTTISDSLLESEGAPKQVRAAMIDLGAQIVSHAAVLAGISLDDMKYVIEYAEVLERREHELAEKIIRNARRSRH